MDILTLAALLVLAPQSPAGETWRAPPAELRPLQIIHGFERVAGGEPVTAERIRAGLADLRERGLGGVVCNVSFHDYLRSEARWKEFTTGIALCRELGLRIWIYDEEGYPSGAAGGLVLAANPRLEAQALTFDPTRDPPFALRAAYEHTHASNNVFAARRYPNLLDPAATRMFIETTHEAYARRLGPVLEAAVEAFFTDEPSLMAVNIGAIPESIRKGVRVVDPLDPAVEPLPSVPWTADLPARYRERWGEELEPLRRQLFEGDSPRARTTRRRFWSLAGDLVRTRYFGALRDWCRAHGVASSGHTLHEESPIHHVPLEGNALAVLRAMDIPGIDMLNSDPAAVTYTGWVPASLAISAALHEGRRLVMTEVSDFVQRMGGKGDIDVDSMLATAAWQAAFGVTELTLYYSFRARTVADYRRYTDFAGRLNAVLRAATPSPEVFLYYPIRTLQEEYRPVAGKLTLESQTERARRAASSFMRLGRTLTRAQVPFLLVDDAALARASRREDRLEIGGAGASVLLVPEESSPLESPVLESWRRAGGRIIAEASEHPMTSARARAELPRPLDLAPPSERIVLGRFTRGDPTIFLLVNTAAQAWKGRLRMPRAGRWQLRDPRDGAVAGVETGADRWLPERTLAPREALLIISFDPGD